MPEIMSIGLPAIDERLNWRTISVEVDKPFVGYTAGAAYCHWFHQVGKLTQPCNRLITHGAVACPRCGLHRRVWRAYVPLFTDGYPTLKRVVMLSKTAMRVVGFLPPWTPVVVRNPGGKDHRPVTMKVDESRRNSERSRKLVALPPHDIRPYLLHLWGDELLAAWAGPQIRDVGDSRIETPLTGDRISAQMDSGSPDSEPIDCSPPEVPTHGDASPNQGRDNGTAGSTTDAWDRALNKLRTRVAEGSDERRR